MIFDQYSRYKACADIIELLNISPKGNLLDIGSGPECQFSKFISEMQATYVDPLIPVGFSENAISGDIYSELLNEKKFNCVIAVDVLEHIPLEERYRFIDRASLLAGDALILAFPSADDSVSQEVDNALVSTYKKITGLNYVWLEEHQKYDLPSVSNVTNYLKKLGWHCQVVGHGHRPWLEELLSVVISSWDIVEFKELILKFSKRFNQEFYPFDFRPPHYRYFVVATRRSIQSLSLAPEKANLADIYDVKLPLYIYGFYFSLLNQIERLTREPNESSVNQVHLEKLGQHLQERVKKIELNFSALELGLSERDAALSERDAALSERDAALSQRDAALSQRDAAILNLEAVWKSKSWQLTKPIRIFARLLRYGFTSNDLHNIARILRPYYKTIPMPSSFRRNIFKFYQQLYFKNSKSVLGLSPLHTSLPSLARRSNEVPDYIVFGIIDWSFRYQRPQQIANELSKKGRRIFFISVSFIDSDEAGFIVEKLNQDATLFNIHLNLKSSPSIYIDTPSLDQLTQLKGCMELLLRWIDARQLVSIVQHPYWKDLAVVLPAAKLVYDCMDYHEGFGEFSTKTDLAEQSLLKNADLVFVSSSWLDKKVNDKVRYCHIMRNACEYEHFSKTREDVYRDLSGRQIIGYYGAIADWFDEDLIKKVAAAFPECCVLLIGDDTIDLNKRIKNYSNILMLGEIAYAELPRYAQAFDVCLIPFKLCELTQATNPVKAYEYLSMGKPVVSVDLPEMRQFSGLCRVASTQQQFMSHIQEALQEIKGSQCLERQEFAQKQTWTHRVNDLMTITESSVLDDLVSIVVVTYNNLYLTQACLDSLVNYSDYSNIEIIVVDNASIDETQSWLKSWVSGADNRRLILNDKNLGFAAANNQGLEIAKGKYLVMLNNDTYVTPGWLRTLVNHIRRDLKIGLIGPVTNNIGNEARISTSYGNMSEMINYAANWTRSHMGQLFQLRTAAFFCVMMHREVFETIGPLDEAFGRGYFEDDDYCRRIEKAGLRVVCAEDVFIHHHLSASFNKLNYKDRSKLFEENKKRYESKWGKWIPHSYRQDDSKNVYLTGKCLVCGKETKFFYEDPSIWRETLNCEHCLATSRYRSIARGILLALKDLKGVECSSLSDIPNLFKDTLNIYDTQPPFYYGTCSYPIPDKLKQVKGINVFLSRYNPNLSLGEKLGKGITNQNLESLTFENASLDIVITSDVMEHVRLDELAHSEIYRVLKPGGIYLFTVPHNNESDMTLVRVQVDPANHDNDLHLLAPEYHGDTNNEAGEGVLSYRVYGRDLVVFLENLGFEVNYFKEDFPELGIMNTELYYCRKLHESDYQL
jgi:GT2 family glycosyltransferase/SAM-dependent methyltransferase/glycosyltransferase involved in cell wall biosynthesis